MSARKYEPAKVGDLFGSRKVVAVLPRDRTSNERVEAMCLGCGRHSDVYVFVLRETKTCRHCARSGVAAIDLTGQRFSRLHVISRVLRPGASHAHWACVCDCGAESVVASGALRNGSIVSCGCFAREKIVASTRTHGLSKSPEYFIWQGIVARCTNPKSQAYLHYGGRGIRICTEWRKDFCAFLSYAGKRPSPFHEIDRIDNNGNYEPGNVRWATVQEQANNRRTNVWLECRSETLTLKQWSKRVGLASSTIIARLKRGLSVEAALFAPRERRRLAERLRLESSR